MTTIEKEVVIHNANGVHTRVAYSLVETASRYNSTVIMRCGDQEVDCSSIVDILSCAATYGTQISLRVTGDDASDATDALVIVLGSSEDP